MPSSPLVPTLVLLAAIGLGGPAFAADATEPLTIALPATSELDRLAELTAQFTGVSLQYNPQKLKGTVRLSVRGQLTQAELWTVFNQVLAGQGFTTVVTGLPAVYQVVPLSEAPGLSVVLGQAESERLPFPPGYAVEVFELVHLGAEPTVKALGALFTNQVHQVRTLGNEQRRVVVAAPRASLDQARAMVARLDRPGVVPAVRLFRPQRTEPQGIQASATAAWSAIGRVGAQPRPAEVQVAPDGAQLVLIAGGEDIEALAALVRDLDESEPVETRTYRPRFFGIDDVASLLQRLLKAEQPNPGAGAIVRDALTSSLIVTATAAQHRRIEEVLRTLDEAPANARRQVRSLPVKHRQADEVAKLISTLMTGASPAAAAPAAGDTAAPASAPTSPPAPGTSGPSAGAATERRAEAASPGEPAPAVREGDFVLTADLVTNRLMVMGDPRAIDQIQTLLTELDQRQPQVELEVILVTLSSSENLNLGVELTKMASYHEVSGAVSSLFGLSQAGADPTARSFPAGGPTGLGGVVIKPGDFAGVVTALERVTDSRSLIRSRVVTNNNARSSIDGVVQQPLTANNATTTVSTTSVSGTTDAGTQITISPQISAADYVTLTYTISQSTFLGSAVTTPNGSIIPPAKRADAITSVATIPDGYVIGLGGLSNRSDSRGETRVPWLGQVPLLGHLFKSTSDNTSDSRFYVFIRADVLRHGTFADLRHLGEQRAAEADLDDEGQPKLKPQFMK